MRRRDLLAGIAALAAGAGCKRQPSRESLLVAGATAMESYTKLLVAGFEKANPGTSVVVEAGGSAAGVVALKRGAIDVATMTRDFTEREDDQLLRNYLVARDGIAILVHPSNPVKNLKMADLRRIYALEARSWREFGGPDAPIEIVSREASHTQQSVRDILLGGDRMPRGPMAASREQMIEIVARDPNALGFSAFAGIAKGVSILAIDGVPLSPLTIVSGRYPLARSFYLVLYGSSSPAAERFVGFAIAPAGQDILDRAGLLPVY